MSCPHFGACGGCTLYTAGRRRIHRPQDRAAGHGAAPRRFRSCAVTTCAHRPGRTAAHGSCRAAHARWRHAGPASAAQRRGDRPDHMPRAASLAGCAVRPLRALLVRLQCVPPRGIGDRQPAGQRPRCAAAHRRCPHPPRSAGDDRVRAQPRTAAHLGLATTNPIAITAATDDIAVRRDRVAAAWCIPAGLRIRRGRDHRGGAQRTARQGARRRTVRRLRHDQLRAGAQGTRRRMGRRCRIGRFLARRGQPRGPQHRRDAARPGAPAVAGEGAGTVRRRRAGPAVRRRRGTDGADRRGRDRRIVIYISCNPATLSRDARMLHQAGYRLRSAQPIDQFLWSARLESVCVFTLARAVQPPRYRAPTPRSPA